MKNVEGDYLGILAYLDSHRITPEERAEGGPVSLSDVGRNQPVGYFHSHGGFNVGLFSIVSGHSSECHICDMDLNEWGGSWRYNPNQEVTYFFNEEIKHNEEDWKIRL